MGIPRFYGQWLRHKGYPGVLNVQIPPNVSSMAIDMNGMIHKSLAQNYAYGDYVDSQRIEFIKTANSLQLEAEFYQILINNLMTILTMVQPRDTLIIAIDGVAPMAKIQQQRQRRYRSHMERRTSTPEGSQIIFDSNVITPGTDFMIRLDRFLQKWLLDNRRYLPPKVIYSSHLTSGEGEHKIMDFYRRGEVNNIDNPNGSHILYGLDADLIMLSLLSPVEDILLTREDINDVINIDNLRSGLKFDLNTPTAVEDFVIMMFLLGNDFLPHGASLTDMGKTIELMISIYKKLHISFVLEGAHPSERAEKNKTGGSEINWESLSKFLQHLADKENDLLVSLGTITMEYPSSMMKKAKESGVFDYNIYRTAWYTNEFQFRNIPAQQNILNLIKNYYPFPDEPIIIPNIEINQIQCMIIKYLEGLSWLHIYYTEGHRYVDLDWYYPYFHSPLLTDIAALALQINKNIFLSYLRRLAHPTMLFTPIHQLAAVLPPQSIDIMPEEIKKLLSIGSQIIDLFPYDFVIELEGVHAKWQGLAIIPFADQERIYFSVEALHIPIARKQIWEEKDNIYIYHREEDEPFFMQQQNIIESQISARYEGFPSRGRGFIQERGFQPRGRGFIQERGHQPRGRGLIQERGYSHRGRGGSVTTYQGGITHARENRQEFGLMKMGSASAMAGSTVPREPRYGLVVDPKRSTFDVNPQRPIPPPVEEPKPSDISLRSKHGPPIRKKTEWDQNTPLI